MKIYHLILALLFLWQPMVAAQDTDNLDLSALIEPADTSRFVKDSQYFNWCSSIIRDKQGTYHLFYSRWPKKYGFFAWLTHSEIAHATARQADGPYLKAKTVLQARKGHWDQITAHNVRVNRFNNRYYLYYISTNSDTVTLNEEKLQEIARTGYSHPYWNLLRSNQRTGVAESSSLYGPWERKEKPMIEPHGPIYTVTVNPSVCQGKDQRYYLIVKGDNQPSGKRHLIQAVGTSDSPTGPFVLEDKPAFADIPTEDVCSWYDKERERFYALFHAHGGNFIGLITSTDGIHWEKAQHYVVCKKEIPLTDGTIMKVDRMERPFLYLENGKPTMLSFGVKKGNNAFIVFFNLKQTTK